MKKKLLIIGSPDCRRVAFFQEALAEKGLAQAEFISYLDLLEGRASLEEHLCADLTIRLESPGQSFAVKRELIALGADQSGPGETITADKARQLEDELGRIYYPAQWYRGFSALLKKLQYQVEKSGLKVDWMNHPEDLLCFFDKRATWQKLHSAGIGCPPSLGPINSYDELKKGMEEIGWSQAFVKLAYSSSASGAAAYRYDSRNNREVLYTTMEPVESGGVLLFYNSLKLKKFTKSSEIAPIINRLCHEGAQVERWLPKASFSEKGYDLRILVAGGRAAQRIVRLSKGPMTNLHLGNERLYLPQLGLSSDLEERLLSECERAMALFPRSLYAGVDIMHCRGQEEPYIIEINGFGDLLLNVTHKGESCYGTEIEAWLREKSWKSSSQVVN